MRRTVTLVAALALALAPAAVAKEITQATVCGTNGCTTITDADTLNTLPLGGDRPVAAPGPQPYYTAEVLVDHGAQSDSFAMLYLPGAELVGANSENPGAVAWLPAYGIAIETMSRVTAGLEPFPRPAAWPTDVREAPVPAVAAAAGSGSRLAGFALALGALVLGALVLVRRRRHTGRGADQPVPRRPDRFTVNP